MNEKLTALGFWQHMIESQVSALEASLRPILRLRHLLATQPTLTFLLLK